MLRYGLIVVLVVLFGLAGAVPAALADPWKDESGHGRGWSGGADHRIAGGPPPWAPAHGYRRKFEKKHGHERHHEHRHVVRAEPRVIELGRCNRDLIGAVLGGAVGGVLGAQIGEGAGRAVATAGGILLGGIIGGAIGARMDERDRACVAHVLELAPQGRLVTWDNPETRVRYELTPLGLYEAKDGRSCREFATKAVIDGKPRWSRTAACRRPDGAWQIVS